MSERFRNMPNNKDDFANIKKSMGFETITKIETEKRSQHGKHEGEPYSANFQKIKLRNFN